MKTIDIRTTQNVTIEYELAPVRERLLAILIDLIIVVAAFIGLIILVQILSINLPYMSGWIEAVVFFFSPLFLFLGYYFFSELTANGQTLGKRAMGTRVVRLDGRVPGLSDGVLRTTFILIDGLLSFGILGMLLISSSPKNQRLGDMTANTAVIRLRSSMRFRLEDILRIDSLEDYEPQYPDVRQLSEEDMLLVKSVINRFRTFQNQAHRKAVNELVDRLCERLDIPERPPHPIEFLRTLLRDYIVLTR